MGATKMPPPANTKINRLLNFSKAADVASLTKANAAVCVPSTIEPLEGCVVFIWNVCVVVTHTLFTLYCCALHEVHFCCGLENAKFY